MFIEIRTLTHGQVMAPVVDGGFWTIIPRDIADMCSDGLAMRYDRNLGRVGEYPFGGNALAQCLDELSEGLLLGMI